jgi:hypothetical protein
MLMRSVIQICLQLFHVLSLYFKRKVFPFTCSEFCEDQEHTLVEFHYEEREDSRKEGALFPPDQQEVNFHVFQDPVASLLQPTVKVIIATFIDDGDHFQKCFWMPMYKFLFMYIEVGWEHQSSRHLLDWLHWHYDFTRLSSFSAVRIGWCANKLNILSIFFSVSF